MDSLPVKYTELTPAMRREVRERYIEVQGWNCYHCGEPLNGKARADVLQKKVTARLFPPTFFKWPVHLHHSHKTGMTIGAVHCYCNAVLWQYHGE